MAIAPGRLLGIGAYRLPGRGRRIGSPVFRPPGLTWQPGTASNLAPGHIQAAPAGLGNRHRLHAPGHRRSTPQMPSTNQAFNTNSPELWPCVRSAGAAPQSRTSLMIWMSQGMRGKSQKGLCDSRSRCYPDMWLTSQISIKEKASLAGDDGPARLPSARTASPEGHGR